MAPDPNRDAYIDLIKRTITNYTYLGGDYSLESFRSVTHYDVPNAQWKIEPLARPTTLLTRNQLDLIERCVVSLQERGVPGDFIEAGVWRGGVIILLRALLNAYGIAGRKVFAADSFAGIPKNARAVGDPVDQWRDRWIASLEDVQQNIKRFGLLDDRIKFVPGFFADTLKGLANETFALMRLDSDSYDSVEESLVYLYPLLSSGGIVIIDDWHLVGCKQAVLNYRDRHNISAELKTFDGNAYWVKS
jgi:O-methyltransferase